MVQRVIDWHDLVRIAERRNPPDRLIDIAGVPARVVPHLSTDAGFYVRTVEEDDSGAYWSLRKAPDLVLLRALVDAGAVTAYDRAAAPRCFVTGCDATEVSPHGRVHTIDGRLYQPCPGHWTAIFALIGEQDPHRED